MHDVPEKLRFLRPGGGSLGFSAMLGEIQRFIEQDPRGFYKVIIGSDSAATDPTRILTAVIVWRIGKGATYFVTRGERSHFYTRHNRIIAETMSSVTLAQEVRSRLRDALGDAFFWDGNEIHADIGHEGETREYIREVTGLIRGMDFVPVIKPEAWCASRVADRHT